MGKETDKLHPLTADQLVRLAAVKIREAVKAGPDKASLSTTESYMVAIAACDRRYLPKAQEVTPTPDLWDSLDDRQRAAVLHYLNAH
ncbi:MAG TPA: hypothetical protein VF534_31070 [Paraburkholderia sp.]